MKVALVSYWNTHSEQISRDSRKMANIWKSKLTGYATSCQKKQRGHGILRPPETNGNQQEKRKEMPWFAILMTYGCVASRKLKGNKISGPAYLKIFINADTNGNSPISRKLLTFGSNPQVCAAICKFDSCLYVYLWTVSCSRQTSTR